MRGVIGMTVRFGEALSIELYGTSHGPCIGVRMEGLPAGRSIDVGRLQEFLDRRAPGRNAWSTPRKEADRPVFLTGVEDIGDPKGKILLTTGDLLIAEIRNTNTRPQDYSDTSVVPRPAHADFPAWVKYGRIESGGGKFSARLTAALCIAGGILLQWMEDREISIRAHIASIGPVQDLSFEEVKGACSIDTEFPVIDRRRGEEMKALIAEVKEAGDSIGGSVECAINGLPPGLGTPLFGSIESRICQSLFCVPAVKGVEFGAGFKVTDMRGSENNDPFFIHTDEATGARSILTETNHHGGILGGLSSGMPILFRAAMKPTPSIAMEQRSVDLVSMEETTLQIKGRHDPCIVPRAVPCIEAAAAIAIGDILMGEGLL